MREMEEIPTIEGLYLFLGFSSYRSLSEYAEKGNKLFTTIVTRAKRRCKHILNQRAMQGTVEPRIAALNLSANHGLSEKKALDIKADVSVKVDRFYSLPDDDGPSG